MHQVHAICTQLLPSYKIMSSTCQTIHYDASQYRVYIPVYNLVFVNTNTKVEMPRAALCVVLCAVYCILANISIRLPPLKFPSLAVSLPPNAPPLLLSLATLLPSSSARFPLPSLPRSVHAYVPSSLFPFLYPPSLPPLPIPLSLTSSLRHSLYLLPPSPPAPCFLPHSPSFLPPSLPPSLPASGRPIQCTSYVWLASCTVLCIA